MIDSGPFSTLPPDVVEKILAQCDFSFSDRLSWHVACPRLFTRSVLLAASLKYYARIIFLDPGGLTEKYSPEEDPNGFFLRHLVASVEAPGKRQNVQLRTWFRNLAARTNGEVDLYGEHLSVRPQLLNSWSLQRSCVKGPGRRVWWG
eukprot:TRINITY_DN1870_c0_g1_i1.p2 TRINITY_DN1870_c0_g1~~TRINITY_DN1870_c0_g1_i1.p2  ORF type:complete len:147 (-),score=8.67 TRINITY_DN1870_c0_g1_i1:1565-2005(-)